MSNSCSSLWKSKKIGEKNMKKLVSILLITLMLGAILSGCAEKPVATSSEPTASTATSVTAENEAYDETVYTSLIANSPGGSAYTVGAAYATIFDEHLNVSMTLMPGGATEAIKAIWKGEADLGFAHNTVIYMASQGQEPFDQVYDDICFISPSFAAAIQVVTLADSKITDLSEVGDKKVGLGVNGSTANTFLLAYLDQMYGITPDSIVANGGSVSYLSDGEVAAALQDGQVDIAFLLGVYPKPNIMEIEKTPGIKLVPLDVKVLDEFISKNPQWTKHTIPAGTYQGQTEDILSVAAYQIWACKANMDEDLAYRLTKAIWSYKDVAAESSSEVKNWLKQEDVLSVMNSVPLHPGAERYYKEIGLIN